MGPSNMYFHSSEPVAVLTPQQPSMFNSHSHFSQSSPSAFSPWSEKRTAFAPSTKKSRGQKRSLDDMVDTEVEPSAAAVVAAAAALRQDYTAASAQDSAMYGKGMTMIQPNRSAVLASSQTDSWAADLARENIHPPISRTTLSSSHATPRSEPIRLAQTHKVQRLDTPPSLTSSSLPSPSASSLVPVTSTPTSISTSAASALGSTSGPLGHSPPKMQLQTAGPRIDDCTHILGIGWTRYGDDAADPHMQAAARGWARYIENHYPLSSVRLLLESKALNAYLVATAQGFFLFQDDLRQGRLVGSTEQATLANLQTVPVSFEGAESLTAVGTPQSQPTTTVVVADEDDGGDALVDGHAFSMELD
ncbi:MAG: hypothetical protein M1825_004189 [Sarcosagium campestre]|nr:MAG: hypothetical protein M1825_004189 [Sarcosagium campestre]